MKIRLNDYVEFLRDNKIVRANVIKINDNSFDAQALVNDQMVTFNNLKEEEVTKIITHTVLIYIDNGDSYLMLYRNKRKDDMNKNKWLGLGGHIEFGESPFETVVREVKEESGLLLFDYQLRGIVYFNNDNYTEVMHLYTSTEFGGEEKECDEGTLKWVKKDEILDLELWDGDKSFLPLLIENEPYFEMELFYENDKLVKINRF